MSGDRQPDRQTSDARRLADYAMAFSLLGDIAEAGTEARAAERILNMFAALCAPGHTTYVCCREEGPGETESCGIITVPPRDVPAVEADALRAIEGRWRRTASGRGFTLRIDDAHGTVGIIEVDDVALPGAIEHYVNLGLDLVSVCALAITNARTFDRLQRTLADLNRALAEVKSLRGLLPICAACKRIRDDAGAWSEVETYVAKHSEAEFTHGICPECSIKLYGFSIPDE
jgi:hypothetical protein